MILMAKRVNVNEGFYKMEVGKENLDWIEQNQETISNWVKQNYKKTASGSTSITVMSFLMVIPVLITRFY